MNGLNTERACCYALTAECLSCAAGMNLDDYCKHNPDIVGCEGSRYFFANIFFMLLVDIDSKQMKVT